ncbi:MAG: hypothetical protein R2940_02455 [Syntrophotaleaceae bacterium]
MRAKLLSIVLFALTVAWPVSDLLAGENHADTTTLLLARAIEMNLATMSNSIKALGKAYVRAYEETPAMSDQEMAKWLARSSEDNQTIIFRPTADGPEPAYQAPQASYIYYRGKKPTKEAWREFNTFTQVAPLFRLAYETFNDSWVYLTTREEAFLIYPYLPLGEAVNNFPPTEQIFYMAADFENRTFGWTLPYLDLAGAGMMVTVSYPLYGQGKLLGVVSRDITLTQLANQTLKPVADSNGRLLCLIMDKNGMAIASSQDKGMREINTFNNEAKTAVLYYGKEISDKSAEARLSSIDLNNQAGHLALEVAKSAPGKNLWNFSLKDGDTQYKASATQIKATGWFVIVLNQVD